MPISRRLEALSLAGLLAACDATTTGNQTAAAPDHAHAVAAGDQVPCARGGAPLAAACTVERTVTDHGLLLTIRRDDGGFRRLLVTRDGRGVIAADGAQPASVAIVGPDRIDVSIGDERYQLPATIKGTR